MGRLNDRKGGIIKLRIQRILGQQVDYNEVFLTEKSVCRLCKIIKKYFDDGIWACRYQFDARHEAYASIKNWLGQAPLFGKVYILWPDFREGIFFEYKRFILFFEELWYPSSDDAWVVDSSFNWLVDLSHEEIFSLYRRTR